MATDPIRDIWGRIRSLGRKVEEEIYDFSEEDAEREEEPRGRNTLIALINSFFTIWKASSATTTERTLGIAAFASVFWWVIIDRGFGFKRTPMRILATTFAIIWFVPGLISAWWTMIVNMGGRNLRHWRWWPLVGVFSLSGLIGFRGVFSELARKDLRPLPKRKKE